MIGTRINAKKIIKGVGGKAYPQDYNWECSICGNINRAFEIECPYCLHEDDQEILHRRRD